MEISIQIDNMIRNYCYNFLSYLYANKGWKRVIFDTSKENIISSYIEEKEIRIIISNTGRILIRCHCFMDTIKAMEFIESEFQYGRMKHYLFADSEVKITKKFTNKIKLRDYFYETQTVYKTEIGEIILSEDYATLIYTEYENGKDLMDVLLSVFNDQSSEEFKDFEGSEGSEGSEDIYDEDKIEDFTEDNNRVGEKMIFTLLMALSVIRLSQLI